MKQIRKRLTYANVMSSLAVFLVLGGATAFAAGHLGKNTVGTKQLKKNAVTTAKIKNGAVTGAKVKLSSLGTVPSATNASHATSADKATTADKATSADNASHADNATHAGSADTAVNAAHAESAGALTAPEAVHFVGTAGEPSFENSYTSGASQLGFYKDRQCVVHLVGDAIGSSGLSAFTLPVADRPTEEAFAAVAVGGPKAGNVEIRINGTVAPFAEGGGVHNYGLDGVTFRVPTC